MVKYIIQRLLYSSAWPAVCSQKVPSVGRRQLCPLCPSLCLQMSPSSSRDIGCNGVGPDFSCFEFCLFCLI